MLIQFDPVDHSDRYNFEILKIHDGGGLHSDKKSKNRQFD